MQIVRFIPFLLLQCRPSGELPSNPSKNGVIVFDCSSLKRSN